jgi:predicted nucleic acid-binding protein
VKAVSNTSPLVFLSKLGYLHHLKALFHQIYVPPAVYREVLAKKDDAYREFEMLVEDSYIAVEEAEPLLRLTALHTGEMEAIALATRLKCWFILDDSKARKIARREGLNVIGTVGLLRVMMKSGLITETAETVFEKLMTYGFRMRKEAFLEILRDHPAAR